MKLYVWPEFNPDYNAGLAFAIAETEEEAKEMILQSIADRLGVSVKHPGVFVKDENWGRVEIYLPNQSVGFGVFGGS